VRRLLPLAAALFIAGCGNRNIDNTEAVRKGVVHYLAKRKSQTGLDMSLMNVEVTNVTFAKNEARATVAFRPKDAKGGATGMAMSYVLERRGDQWVVKGRQDSGSHSGGQTMPGAMPGGMPGAMPGATPGALPPNHPPVDKPGQPSATPPAK